MQHYVPGRLAAIGEESLCRNRIAQFRALYHSCQVAQRHRCQYALNIALDIRFGGPRAVLYADFRDRDPGRRMS